MIPLDYLLSVALLTTPGDPSEAAGAFDHFRSVRPTVQMLAIARALYTDPRLLLLDEISMGLAPLVVAELYELVGQLVAAEDITVVLVEQFAQTALTVADQVAVMVNGRIVRSGTPAEVGDNLMSAYMGSTEG